VAISNQRETFGIFGERGEPIRRLSSGSTSGDGPDAPVRGELRRREDPRDLRKPVDITPCLYRMVWLRENEPNLLIAPPISPRSMAIFASGSPAAGQPRPPRPTAGRAGHGAPGLVAGDSRSAGVPIDKNADAVRPGALIGNRTEAATQATGLSGSDADIRGGGDGQCAVPASTSAIRPRLYQPRHRRGLGSYSSAMSSTRVPNRDRRSPIEAISTRPASAPALLVDWTCARCWLHRPSARARGADRSRAEASASPSAPTASCSSPTGRVHDPLLGSVGPGVIAASRDRPGAAISIARCWRA